MPNSSFRLCSLALILLIHFTPATSSADDEPIVVTSVMDVTDDDDGVLTLREAIEQAKTNGHDDDIITFANSLDGGKITLASPLPLLLQEDTCTTDCSFTIGGDNAHVTISGDNEHRVFFVTNNTDVVLSNLTIADGLAQGGDGAGNGGGGLGAGGGVFVDNRGVLTLSDVSFESNAAQGGDGGTGGTGGTGLPLEESDS